MPAAGAVPERRPFAHWVGVFLAGMCMGAADIVPGISGGTVAFIIGVYPELLESLKSINGSSLKLLVRGRAAQFFRTVNWRFLLALIGGIAFSFLTLAKMFSEILLDETSRVYLFSAFLGLVLASVWFCSKQVTEWRSSRLAGLTAGIMVAYALTTVAIPESWQEDFFDVDIRLENQTRAANYQSGWLQHIPETAVAAMIAKGVITPETMVTNVRTGIFGAAGELTSPGFGAEWGIDLWAVFCGTVAVSAMLLPGISGSYLLTILGMYSVAIAALADFVGGAKRGVFEWDAFLLLTNLAVGVVLGALIFSRVVSWAMRRYHDATIATLVGFMVGALGSVWPFWSYRYEYLPLKLEKGPQLVAVAPVVPDVHEPLFFVACLFAFAGFITVFGLEWFAGRSKK